MYWKFLIKEFISLRTKHGLSVRSIEAGSKVAPAAINVIEKCERCPSLEVFQRMLLTMGYSLKIVPVFEVNEPAINILCYEEIKKVEKFNKNKHSYRPSAEFYDNAQRFFETYMVDKPEP